MYRPELRISAAVYCLIFVMLFGVAGLMFFEHWSILDAFWVTIESITTTGFGDKLPITVAGKVFLMVLLIMGAGVVAYSLGSINSYVLEVQMKKALENKDFEKAVGSLNNHIIICGAGRVGSNVVDFLSAEKVSFILIDDQIEQVESMLSQGYLAIHGDATNDDVLVQAGITRARGVISALPDDAYNVFVTLTAKAMNPNLMVVARAEKPETIEKLKRAGADKIIAPAQIGGQRMAAAMLKPASVQLVDTLFSNRGIEIDLEEYLVSNTSNLTDKEIKVVFNRAHANITVAAIIRGNDAILSPSGSETIRAGDTLILLGARQYLDRLEEIVSR